MVSIVPLIYIASYVIFTTTDYHFKDHNFIIINNMELPCFNPTCTAGGWYLTMRQINKLNKVKNGNIAKNRPKVRKK